MFPLRDHLRERYLNTLGAARWCCGRKRGFSSGFCVLLIASVEPRFGESSFPLRQSTTADRVAWRDKNGRTRRPSHRKAKIRPAPQGVPGEGCARGRQPFPIASGADSLVSRRGDRDEHLFRRSRPRNRRGSPRREHSFTGDPLAPGGTQRGNAMPRGTFTTLDTPTCRMPGYVVQAGNRWEVLCRTSFPEAGRGAVQGPFPDT
jgi:hypothetical protein